MAKETAAQRRTRISMLLAEFDARNRELRKLVKIVDGLKEQVREVPSGTYGEWQRADGTPREINDMAAIKQHYADLGLEVPTRLTDPPLIVSSVAK